MIEWYKPHKRKYPYSIPSPIPISEVKRITITAKNGKRFILKKKTQKNG